MLTRVLVAVVAAACTCCTMYAEAARVLAVLPTNSRSHNAVYEPILHALAARGHQVTIITHFPLDTPPANVEQIGVIDPSPEWTNNVTVSDATHGNDLKLLMTECVKSCRLILEAPLVRPIMQLQYDLVVIEVFGSDCFVPYARHFSAPLIGLLSSVSLAWLNPQIGNPEAVSYVPTYNVGYSQQMRAHQRAWNAISVAYGKMLYWYESSRPSQVIAEETFGPLPSLNELASNYSLVLVNSHFSMNDVRPLVPALVEVGGVHLHRARHQQLTHELETIMRSSPSGVLYWSFGSMVRVDSIEVDTLRAVLSVFARLPQTVLIKMDVTRMPTNITLPANVYAFPWLPQYAVLCHPTTQVYIAHGGLLGLQESVACGVPALIVPLFADQPLNAATMESRGVAKVLPFDKLGDADMFGRTLNDLLQDPKYKINAVKLSKVFLDRLVPPIDTAVYWLEYVLRHNGAPHLRSPGLDLAWYQHLLLDILAMFLAAVLVIYYSLRFVSKQLYQVLKNHGFMKRLSVLQNHIRGITKLYNKKND